LIAAGGGTYHVVVGPVRDSPRLFGELELPRVPLTLLAIALGVSAAVCFFSPVISQVQAPGELRVSGDPELLRSAFENVIRNAVRYSPAGALVGITAHRLAGEEHPGGLVEVVIRDQGPGVPEKELGLIFEPFYRVDAARGHGSAGGEGLGLAIAARAVALHGGGIDAHNLAAGGLLMTIRLPAMARERSRGQHMTGAPA
jgi:signal transduction histidine kinase